MLAGIGRRARGFEMHAIGRRIDDGLDVLVVENGLVTRHRAAAIFGGEGRALFLGAGIASGDRELAGTVDRVGQHVGPPAHAKGCDAQRLNRHHLARLYTLS